MHWGVGVIGQLWTKSGDLEFDNNGVRAPGALAYFYEAGTTTPQPVFTTADENATRTHPVVADANGRWPEVHIPFGSYGLTIKTAGGTTLFTSSSIPNPEPTDTSASVDANALYQTGDTILSFKNGTRTGFVRLNGRTIGNASSSATERANADTSALFEYVWNNSLDAQCAVSGGRGASGTADFAAAKRITLPDLRGATPFGFDDMGNTAASLMGSAPVVSGSAILAGSIIGANTHALTTAQLASHTHALTGITVSSTGAHTHTATTTTTGSGHNHTVTDPGHVHGLGSAADQDFNASTVTSSGGQLWATTAINTASNTTGITIASTDGTHTHTISTTSDPGNHTHTLSGTVDANGSGTAHNIVSRGVPFTFLMKL